MERIHFSHHIYISSKTISKLVRSAPTVLLLVLIVGCAIFDPKPAGTPVFRDQPKEGATMSLPHYYIESPDVITVEAINLIPKSPYLLRSGDAITVEVEGALEEDQLTRRYAIQPGGIIQLGANYGPVKVGGMSADDAEKVIVDALRKRLKNPKVSVEVSDMSPLEMIAGNHLVAPDGYITLGSYGRVYVQGLTVPECREAIELKLSQQLESPVVAVDMFAYNSKEYFVILQGAAGGDMVYSYPYMGNETVLKAIANVNGLQPFSSKRIWIARPVGNTNKPLILPVDWNATTAYGVPQTNYQIIPNDRVYVQVDNWAAFDQRLAKVFAPFERIMGFMLLGATTVSRYSGDVLAGGAARGTGGNY
ncbi:MAG: polysaccharide biosynthesis/export family protein [Thermoguttaceae bacterium]